MKYTHTKDGVPFPEICPFCGSDETVVARYKDGSRFAECDNCCTVIGEVKGKRIVYSGALKFVKRQLVVIT